MLPGKKKPREENHKPKSLQKNTEEKHRRTFAKKANTVNILMVRLLIGSCRGQILRYLQSAMSVPDLKVY